MQIYLPVAEMTVPVESVLILAVFVGFLSGVFGVGGGFLTTPFLIFMGLPPAIAVGTQASQLVAASVTGVLGHFRRSNVDVRLGLVMLAGGLAGSVVGVILFRLLRHFGQIDLAIALLYITFLGSIGLMMFVESLLALIGKSANQEKRLSESLKQSAFLRNLPYKMRFPQSRLYVSALLPASIGFVGGVLVSVMGIGGGFLLVPAMIYLLGMPTLLVVGTSLFQILFTSIFATLLHATMNQTVDLVLGSLLIIGGVIGAQAGVRVARKLKGAVARILLATLVVMVSVLLAGELLIRPVELYATAPG